MSTESNRVEYKAILTDKLEREVVAFLNYHDGGVIYIGIDDNGNAIGVENADKTQLQIIDRIKNNILPHTLGLFDVVLENIDNKTVIKIVISSGNEKPYYIKTRGMSPGGCFIRVGSSAQPMTTKMIDEVYAKRARQVLLYNIPSPRQELAFSQLKIYYEEKGLELGKSFKKNLDLLLPDGSYNYVAYLLADNNTTSIKIAKYKGKDKVELIESEEYGFCSLVKATHKVIDKLEIENKTFTQITSSAARKERQMVNGVALREAVINAIVHNDYSRDVPPLLEIYSDRLTITSYGGLVDGYTKEDLLNCITMPRNRELMRVFRDLDLVEQLGSGMSRILKIYDESIFTFTPNFMIVTFYFEQGFKNKVSENDTLNDTLNLKERNILKILNDNHNISSNEIAEQMNLSQSTIKRYLTALNKKGIIIRAGSKKTGHWEILR